MADDQREPLTVPPATPAEPPDPQASAPATEPVEASPVPAASPEGAPEAVTASAESPAAPSMLQASVSAPPDHAAEPPATLSESAASVPAPPIEPVDLSPAVPDPQAVASAPPATPAEPPAAPPDSPDGSPEESALEEDPPAGRRALTFFREFVETILLTLVIFVAVRTLVVNFRVDGESMRPTLVNGEYLLVNRATYFHFDLNALRNLLPGPDRQDRDIVYLFGPPERGDIIVFEPPISSDKPFVKRVIGLPGDTIAIKEDHRVYVNGQPLEEDYIAAPPQSLYPRTGGEYTVPPGTIFVMGDNRNNSQDSRSFPAPVPLDSVIGKAIVSYWPLDGFGFIPHERYAQAGDER